VNLGWPKVVNILWRYLVSLNRRRVVNFADASTSMKKLMNDMYRSTYEAANLTRSVLIVVDVLKGNKSNLKDGDTLDLRGMSSAQLTQFLQALLKQGFKGTVHNQ
ncbi:hypothetical protein, partial [Parafilimonas terrae]